MRQSEIQITPADRPESICVSYDFSYNSPYVISLAPNVMRPDPRLNSFALIRQCTLYSRRIPAIRRRSRDKTAHRMDVKYPRRIPNGLSFLPLLPLSLYLYLSFAKRRCRRLALAVVGSHGNSRAKITSGLLALMRARARARANYD